MSLLITPVNDLDSIERFQSVLAASFDADHEGLPADTVAELVVEVGALQTDFHVLMWLGELAGEPIAAGRLSMPVNDNTATAMIDIHVHPDHRRAGHGLVAARYGLDLVASQGRRIVIGDAWSPLTDDAVGSAAAPAAFAARLGARPVLEAVRRVLDLAGLDLGQLDRSRRQAAAAATDYQVVQWADAAPAALHDDLARLSQLMSTDPPLGDMTWEPEVWDAARWRDGERRSCAKGYRAVGSAAVHLPTGRAVGYSDIGVSRRWPQVGYQWATIVESAHRGHRLGTLLKAANLQLLISELPDTRLVNTWNAAVNTHMISVNETLGFRPVERWTEWQLEL